MDEDNLVPDLLVLITIQCEVRKDGIHARWTSMGISGFVQAGITARTKLAQPSQVTFQIISPTKCKSASTSPPSVYSLLTQHKARKEMARHKWPVLQITQAFRESGYGVSEQPSPSSGHVHWRQNYTRLRSTESPSPTGGPRPIGK